MITDAKIKLRSDLREKRRLFIQKSKDTPFFQDIEPFFYHFLQDTLKVTPHAIIGGYWPLKDEADCRPLLTFLSQLGFSCALPYVDAKDTPLSFRAWAPEDLLTSCPYYTDLLQPLQSRPLLTPNVLLIPFLGFDKQGHRLGYGGGFYDRTLHHLRQVQKEPLIAIGVGFSMQEVEPLPTTSTDEPLDWILTEQGLRQPL
ncbi:MAG: 5-formyltetrahydrofolate cyclo-ligase [Alphaproteobacteria bacterium 16-39-46]|nr:MAG: 5-formyltetrahydrofolate cyclo-ligase [Alphaproteobacteria bacterium 16-39-46]OZA41956.1 MAG: 5-formyltetrahydrofolate cyclo-ligase [Alphaproteobacteria bacterium 17-39-52]HQS84649.1 5-formyltetrahydrofolate cyclo-ligase [Alphaproteobacteria bacterium]HQS94461.1 5-formyltetrahydrofolate cyclo-ligase [Alphaproteobacteria bacterium]